MWAVGKTTAHFFEETTKMINVNKLKKVKSNFPVMVSKGAISKKDCEKLIDEIINIVEKYHMFPKFHLLKPNGAGSLFHGTLVKFSFTQSHGIITN